MTSDIHEIMARLAEPFAPESVGWKPQSVSGNRAMALAYIDARDVQDRLDEVVGCHNWQTRYEVQADGNVVCILRLRLEGEWIEKSDVGGPSDQKDVGDRMKATFSDAFKRAAVVWGIGRYLYRLEASWCDYDPQKKKFTKTPTLPATALPRYVSGEQVEELRGLLQQTDRNETSFLEALMFNHFGNTPESMDRLPCRLYQEARTKLRGFLARQAKIKAEMATGVRKAAEPAAS